MSSTLNDSYTLHFSAGPFLTPPNEPQYAAAAPDVVDSGSQVQNDLPVLETVQHDDNLSSTIGMAMLELADNAPAPSPSVLTNLADEREFDPYDHIDQSGHHRVPSFLVSAQPESSIGQTCQTSQNAVSMASSTKLDVIRPPRHSRDDSDPPTYTEYINDEDAGQLSNKIPSEEQKQSQSSSESSQNAELLANARPQQHSNDSDSGHPSDGLRNLSFLPPDRNIPPAVSRDQRLEGTQATQYTSPAQVPPLFLHPHRALSLPSVEYGSEPDVQSTHYSTSTYSSGQFQNGRRPPPRHLPKRLVMPSPLNTGPPPNVEQTHLQPTPFNQHPSHQFGNLPMAIQNTRTEDVPIIRGHKLRKKTSLIVTPTPAPVITTVSFVPPIIGFHRSHERGITQSKTEVRPKKVLSKRKT